MLTKIVIVDWDREERGCESPQVWLQYSQKLYLIFLNCSREGCDDVYNLLL